MASAVLRDCGVRAANETMGGFQIKAQDAKGQVRRFHLQALQSEPNLWKVLEVSDESQAL